MARRAFLARAAGAMVLGTSAACRRGGAVNQEEKGAFNWSGIGFGIEMSMELHGVTRAEGEKLGIDCERLIGELERAFSLYLESSELSVLNRERELAKPSRLFLEVLATGRELNRRTLGYFQPAVHGVWKHLDADPRWRERLAGCDMRWLQVNGGVKLRHPLTELSFNALVQGELADRMAERVRAVGVKSAMLHLGETVAVGCHPEGRPWRLAISGTQAGENDEMGRVEFEDAGLAVSAQGPNRVLLDPVAGELRKGERVVAVVSDEGAAVADAFATAFAVAPTARRPELVRRLNAGSGAGVGIWERGVRVLGEGVMFERVAPSAGSPVEP